MSERREILRQGDDSFVTTKIDAVINWSRKYSFFVYPFVTACCGMEYMSVAGPRYDLDRFGAALPRFSPRQADLLMVVGTISHRQAPILKKVYEQMAEPKWVLAFGACTCSGDRHDRPGRRLCPRLSAASRGGARRDHQASAQGPGVAGLEPAAAS
jgi:NADH-quinone oxidoreductase subunit B